MNQNIPTSKPVYQHNPFPQQLVIEATAGCNQRCVFCGRTYMDRPKKTISDAHFRKIVEEVARENPTTEIWPTFMGEAMLLGHQIFDWVTYAREVGCKKITLNTNGTKFTDEIIPRIIEGGLDRLIISCDAHTTETHRIVRPATRPTSDNTLTNIYKSVHKILDLKASNNALYPLIEMQFSIFDENEHEVDDFREYWSRHDVVVKVRPRIQWSGNVTYDNHTPPDTKDRTPCLWSLETMAVHWNGNVVMCAIDCDGKYVAGNVETQSLKEIWNGPLKWNRELQIQERFTELSEICRQCPDWNVKRAATFYPNEDIKNAYEYYIRTGRVFMQSHIWERETKELVDTYKKM